MRVPRIYTDLQLDENVNIQLSKSESHYLATVLRMKPGRQISVFNGVAVNHDYGEYAGEILEISKKGVVIQLGAFQKRNVESLLQIELGVALIKNDRMDWLVQKATELGVTSITPVLTEYTDVKLSADRQDKKVQHWRQVAIHACEQSGRVRVPTLNAIVPLGSWLKRAKADTKIVLHPYQSSALGTHGSTVQSVAVLIGPEGGLTDQEVEWARTNEFNAVALGNRILRAETAPLALLSILQYQFGDFT